MRRLSRALATSLVVGVLVAGAAPAAAQDASPDASPPASGPIEGTGSLEGEATYSDAEGVVRGTITIRAAADPFTEFDPTRPPPEGARYIQLVVTFEASEEQTFATEPGYLMLQDADGFLYPPAFLPRPVDASPPDLQGQTLSPFDRVSGSVGYTVPIETPIVRALYLGDGQRLLPVSEAIASTVAATGEPTAVRTREGLVQGTITLHEVADPYLDHDPARPPADGQRYVLVTAAFEAAADQPMVADPWSLMLIDERGVLYRPTVLPRPEGELLQDIDRQALSPGDRVSGVLGYVVPTTAVMEGVVYGPEHNRFLALADLVPGG